MDKNDFQDFATLLDESYALISQGRTTLQPGSKALFFKAMERYPLKVVRKAFQAHLLDPDAGKFCPVPAHLIAKINALAGSDGRPEADEAWAIALKGADEAETVVWTAEMRQAFEICKSVLTAGRGDKIGARKAFIDAYNRLVLEARRAGLPATWSASLGRDPEKRELVVREAERIGRLPAPEVAALLPPPVTANEIDRSGIARLKEELSKLVPGSVRAAQRREEERKAEEEKKREIAERVADYTQVECA